MKEFQSQTGGRPVYSNDFQNLQEFLFALQSFFNSAPSGSTPSGFVISGCTISGVGHTISIGAGYVFLGGKIRYVAAKSSVPTANLYIIAREQNGDTLTYADNTTGFQYIDYYAEIINSENINGTYIAYDHVAAGFPNIENTFFNQYALCKNVSNQSINNLSVQTLLKCIGSIVVNNGIVFGENSPYSMKKDAKGNFVFLLQNGETNVYFTLTKRGTMKVQIGNADALEIVYHPSDNSLAIPKLSVENIEISGNTTLREQNLFDITNPLGMINLWAGNANNIPTNYVLCDGRELSKSAYEELYAVIGETYNRCADHTGATFPAPESTNFRIPDLRSRFIVGYDASASDYNAVGKTGGVSKVTLSANQSGVKPHVHSVSQSIANIQLTGDGRVVEPVGGSNNPLAGKTSTSWILPKNTNAISGESASEAHENRPPFYTLAYIMRVK